MFYRDAEKLQEGLKEVYPRPGDITATCIVVRNMIEQHSIGVHFLSEAQRVIDRIFLAKDGRIPWLREVSKPGYEKDAESLQGILRPDGCLLSLLSRVNEQRCFDFLVEDLPPHTKKILGFSNHKELLSAWPQYWGANLRNDESAVMLPVLVYFFFAFAHFAVEGSSKTRQRSKGTEGRFTEELKKKTAQFLHFGSKKEPPKGVEPQYLTLLESYVRHFLPRDRHRADPKSTGESIHVIQPSVGGVFLGTLEEFWLSDDFEPIPKGITLQTQVQGAESQMQAENQNAPRRSARYKVPSSTLATSLMILFEHVNQDWGDGSGPPHPAMKNIRWIPFVPAYTHPPPKSIGFDVGFIGSEAGSAASQALFRRLFRFLWRTLDGYGASNTSSLSKIMKLWLLHACPWQGLHQQSLARRSSSMSKGKYSRLWLPHILSNFPFYNVLLPMWLRLTLSRISQRSDSAVQDLIQVLKVFKSEQLRNVLSSIEISLTAYMKNMQGGRRQSRGEYSRLIPHLYAQMEDWTGAAKSGGLLRGLQVIQSDFSVFSPYNTSVCGLVEAILVEAEGCTKPEHMGSLCSIVESIFGVRLPEHTSDSQPSSPAKSKGIPWNQWDYFYSSKHYDPMHRMPTTCEVSFLAEWTVSLSDSINRYCQLPGKPHYVHDIQVAEELERDTPPEDPPPVRWEEPTWLIRKPEDHVGLTLIKGLLVWVIFIPLSLCRIVYRIVYSFFCKLVLPYIRHRHPSFRVNLRMLSDRTVLCGISFGLYLLCCREFHLYTLLIFLCSILYIKKIAR